MSSRILVQIVWVFVASTALASSASAAERAQANGPSLEQAQLEAAQLNAIPIFNSVHSALRQWGSSLDHNGLAMIPAKVPKGNLLYHGTHSDDVTGTGMEWLAFEPEHSEVFAMSWRAPRPKANVAVGEQATLQSAAEQRPAMRGYLRTYQASRDLNLLYLDGMSAGKGCLGTMDAQDLVLRLINGTSPCDTRLDAVMVHDVARVGELCRALAPLGYDGLLRMEAGFEIVYCDFDDGGLALLSQLRRPFWDQMRAWYDLPRLAFQLARVASQHYDGFAEAGRVQLDLSRMVSAYFFPVNITTGNPEAAAAAAAAAAGGEQATTTTGRLFPRLLNTTRDERQAIQRRVHEVAADGGGPGINWQAIVDAVVSRYADRLALLLALHLNGPRSHPEGAGGELERFVAEVFVATNTHVDASSTPGGDLAMDGADGSEVVEAARTRCQGHYLQQVEPSKSAFTPEDHLIYTAIRQVTGRICGTLFEVRALIEDACQSKAYGERRGRTALFLAAVKGQKEIQQLVSDLQWTKWEKCGGCASDEVCFVPMFPLGSVEDHRGPRCLNESGLELGLDLETNYWRIDIRAALKDLTEGPF